MLLPGSIAAAVAVLALWVLYFVSDEKSNILGLGRLSWLALAAVATLFGPPILFLVVRGWLKLMEHVVEVDGVVVKIAVLPITGTRPVTYGYAFNGKQYSFKKDTAATHIANMTVGSRVRMLVDPQKPNKAMVWDYEPEW